MKIGSFVQLAGLGILTLANFANAQVSPSSGAVQYVKELLDGVNVGSMIQDMAKNGTHEKKMIMELTASGALMHLYDESAPLNPQATGKLVPFTITHTGDGKNYIAVSLASFQIHDAASPETFVRFSNPNIGFIVYKLDDGVSFENVREETIAMVDGDFELRMGKPKSTRYLAVTLGGSILGNSDVKLKDQPNLEFTSKGIYPRVAGTPWGQGRSGASYHDELGGIRLNVGFVVSQGVNSYRMTNNDQRALKDNEWAAYTEQYRAYAKEKGLTNLSINDYATLSGNPKPNYDGVNERVNRPTLYIDPSLDLSQKLSTSAGGRDNVVGLRIEGHSALKKDEFVGLDGFNYDMTGKNRKVVKAGLYVNF